MQPDIGKLYQQMLRARLFEELLQGLWEDGLISGEMHLGTGEEGVIVGVLDHLGEGDAIALDHRPTPALVTRGVDLKSMVLEMLGSADGLCAGRGGHMHMFSREHLAASSGIVGASGPLGAGFALAAQQLRPGSVAVAFFGEGAMNQGMLMESLNLAVAWRLPVLFVCKDNRWEITTRAGWVTGGDLAKRARSFGLCVARVRGTDVMQVWKAAERLVEAARRGHPGFLHARCPHHEGHFLGDPMLLVLRRPVQQLAQIMPALIRSYLRRQGGSLPARTRSMSNIVKALGIMGTGHWLTNQDPLCVAARGLDAGRMERLEADVREEMERVLDEALQEWGKERTTWQ